MLRVFGRAFGCVLTLASCCVAGSATAEQYPSRSVRMVVAAPPGGLTDIVARSVSQFLQEKLGQPFMPLPNAPLLNAANDSSWIRTMLGVPRTCGKSGGVRARVSVRGSGLDTPR